MLKKKDYGTDNLGIRFVSRNTTSNKKFTRRYVRFIFKILGYRLMIELKFRNSI